VPNVLILEPDIIVRNLLIRVLSGQGFTVYEASNAQEALELFASIDCRPLTLLIADHETAEPAVTGHILASGDNTHVLHISDQSLAHGDGTLLPGSSFLKKPFTQAKLLQTVQELLYPRMQ